MAPRLELEARLRQLLGSTNVYFQPPPSVQMSYPAIVYHRDNVDIKHADNRPYGRAVRYRVTVIDRDPDSDIPERIETLPSCTFSAAFKEADLNHDVYTLFY